MFYLVSMNWNYNEQDVKVLSDAIFNKINPKLS